MSDEVSGLGPGGRPARLLLERLLEVSGDQVDGVVLFGSQLVGSSPSPHSAYDFVVVVREYRAFFDAFVPAAGHRRSAGTLSRVSRVLAPSVLAFMPDLPEEHIAKILLASREDFRRGMSPEAPDHFLKGRMSQQVALLHARDDETARRLEARLEENRRDVLRWAGPFVAPTFTPGELARRMLQASYRGEIRPESSDRVDEVYEAQADVLDRMYRAVLEEAVDEGRVTRSGAGRYAFVQRPTARDRRRVERYFLRSKVRATLRWFKHIFTYDDWLTYIQRKVERRTGRTIELTSLERKLPLIFLWPKAIRVIRSLPGSGTSDERGA